MPRVSRGGQPSLHGTGRWVAAVLVAALAAAAGTARAQDAVIRGTVRSDRGEWVEGASITIPELGISTATRADGQFQITIPGARVQGQRVSLRVRMVGFRPSVKVVAVAPGEQVVGVTLESDLNRLAELVVTGVMEATPQTATAFSVARVDMSDLPVPAADPLSQLVGVVSGTSITAATGRPGATPDVLLRGPTSINASGRTQEPLYIVDGIIVGIGQPSVDLDQGLAALNPQDIESIEIVKGAAGASMYGARAANGVINITTKSGRTEAEGTRFRIRSEAGVSDIEREPAMSRQHLLLMDATGRRFCIADQSHPLCARTVDWKTEMDRVNNAPGTGAGIPAALAYDPSLSSTAPPLRNTFVAEDWPVPIYDQVRQVVTNHAYISNDIEVTGRLGGTRYFASGSQLRQGGAIRYLDGSSRYTARLNVDPQVADNVSLSLRTYFAHNSEDGWSQEGNGPLFYSLALQPAPANLLARDTLGRLYVRTTTEAGSGQYNPLWMTSAFGLTDLEVDDRFQGAATLRWAPVSFADLEAAFAYDHSVGRWDYQIPKGIRSQSPTDQTYLGYLENWEFGGSSYNASVNLTLQHELGRDLGVRWQFRYLYEEQDHFFRDVWGSTLAVAGVDALNNITQGISITSSTTTEKLIGLFAGVKLDYRQKLVGDFLLRRDGSSLFGAGNRWATFGRVSAAYRPSQESWWPLHKLLNEFKLRASYGTAGGRPSFAAQYETYDLASGGTLSLGHSGNRDLRPEINVELELGADLEVLRRVGIVATYAHSDTRDQILLVPAPAISGFSQQWRNAGTLTNSTWELSLNVPLVRTSDFSWSWRFNYDRTSTVITQLGVPPFSVGVSGVSGTGSFLRMAQGERYGTIYGRYFLRGAADCGRLPAPYGADCGAPGKSFQVNDEGWLVWTGGLGVGQGITRNAWQAQLPAGAAPWGVALNWGMPIVLRDTTCLPPDPAHPSYKGSRSDCPPLAVPLGHGLPDWRFSVGQTLQYRRFTVYALLEGVVGRSLWNQLRQWSYLYFKGGDLDQGGKSPATAKPIGYYWRSAPPENANGLGGFYNTLMPTNESVENGSYAKLRVLSVGYRLGALRGFGSWEVTVSARNLFTVTKYRGFDPETGISPQNWPAPTGSGLVNAVDAAGWPTMRTFALALSASF